MQKREMRRWVAVIFILLTSSCVGGVDNQTRYDLTNTPEKTTSQLMQPTVTISNAGPSELPRTEKPDLTETASASPRPTEPRISADVITKDNLQAMAILQAIDTEERPQEVEWSPDGSLLGIAWFGERQLHGFPDTTHFIELELADVESPACCETISFSPMGDRVAGAGGFLQQWSLPDGGKFLDELAVGSPINAVSFSPNGSQLALGFRDGALVLPSEKLSPQALFRPDSFTAFIDAVGFRSETELITVGDDGRVRRWNTINGQQIATFGEFAISDFAFGSDNSRLITGSSEQTLQLWNIERASIIWEVDPPEDPPFRAVDISPEGQLIAVGNLDGEVLILDAGDGSFLHRLPQPGASVRSITFSPDGRHLAVARSVSPVEIWGIDE